MAFKKYILALSLGVFSGTVDGQNLLSLGGSGLRPDFVGEAFEVLPGGENWLYSLNLEQVYDSNPDLLETNERDRYYSDLTAKITYLTDPGGGAPNRFRLSYNPRFRQDWSDSDRSEILHHVNADFQSKGARGELLVYGSIQELSNSDSLAARFLEGRIQSIGANLSYEVATRSRLLLRAQIAESVFDTRGVSGTRVADLGFGFDWGTENEWKVGPFLRYSNSLSDTVGTRETLGLLASVQKTTADGFSLRALAGVDFGFFEDSSDNAATLTASLQARGRFSEDWNWSTELDVVTLPSVSDTGVYFTDYSLSASAIRSLAIGSIEFGGEIRYTRSEALTSSGREDSANTVVEVSGHYKRPIFADAASLGVGASYQFSRGENDWDRFNLILNIGTSF